MLCFKCNFEMQISKLSGTNMKRNENNGLKFW